MDGASLRLPKRRPTKYAAVSEIQTVPSTPSKAAQNTIQPALGNRKSAERKTASEAAAVITRVLSMDSRASPPARQEALCDPPPAAALALVFFELLAGAPEAALAVAIPSDRRVELLGVEIRPQRRGEIQLGIRKLPKQEITDALLASGANEQIRFWRVVERQMRSELLLGISLGRQRAAARELQQSLHQIPAAAVVGSNRERKRRIVCGELLGAAREFDHTRPERRYIADYLEAHLVLVQPLGFLL